jgi:hypothetical protein
MKSSLEGTEAGVVGGWENCFDVLILSLDSIRLFFLDNLEVNHM